MGETRVTIIPSRRAVNYCTYANLPATATSGDLGFATDRLTLYRWDGTAWQPITLYVSSGAIGDIPTAGNLPNGSIYHATDRDVIYQVQSGAWQPITLHIGSGAYGDIPTAGDLPNGSIYHATDRDILYQVQSGAWQPITFYAGSGAIADIPTVATLPNGSTYYSTDEEKTYQVQAGAWVDITPAKGSELTVSETEVYSGSSPTSWTDLDLSSTIGAKCSLVMLRAEPQEATSAGKYVAFRRNGSTADYYAQTAGGVKRCIHYCLSGISTGFLVETDSAGKIEWKAGEAKSYKLYVEAYIN